MSSTTARGRDAFNKRKKQIMLLVKFVSKFSVKKRKKWLVKNRKKSGKKGLLIRYVLIKSLAKSCGDNVSIFEDVFIFSPENMEIGNNVSIQPMCYLEGQGGISIGNDVSIAHSTSILSTTHNTESLDIPIKDQGVTEKKVTIHDNVWIGCKVTVLCGNEINSGSVIGANSVVTKDIEPNCICAGVPAKKIRSRK